MINSVTYEDIESKELMQIERKQNNFWKTAPKGLENNVF